MSVWIVRRSYRCYTGCVNGVPGFKGSYRRAQLMPIETARQVIKQLTALGYDGLRMVNRDGKTVK